MITNILSYIILGFTGVISWFFFRVLNRTKIFGQENIPVPSKISVLLASNHRTMIDSFLIGTIAYFPLNFLYPKQSPYHPAAEENFFASPFLTFFFHHLRCLPVRKGRKDLSAFIKLMKILRQGGNILIFPEGTRSRTKEIGQGQDGVGALIYKTRPLVIPVFVDGLEKILPARDRRLLPRRLFQKITLIFGKPIDFSSFYQRPNKRQTWQDITACLMEAIKKLQKEHQK